MRTHSLAPLLWVFFVAPSFALAGQSVSMKMFKSSRPGYMKAEVTVPVFGPKTPVRAAASAAFMADAMKAQRRFLSDTKKEFAELGKPRSEYFIEIKPTVAMNDGTLVSGYLTHFEYTGGAHPNTDHRAYTFGIVGGKAKRLTLADLLANGTSTGAFTNEVIVPALNEIKKARGIEPVTEVETKLVENFVVTPGGMTFIFPHYSVGAYAEGTYMVKLAWIQLEGKLNPDGPIKALIKKQPN